MRYVPLEFGSLGAAAAGSMALAGEFVATLPGRGSFSGRGPAVALVAAMAMLAVAATIEAQVGARLATQ